MLAQWPAGSRAGKDHPAAVRQLRRTLKLSEEPKMDPESVPHPPRWQAAEAVRSAATGRQFPLDRIEGLENRFRTMRALCGGDFEAGCGVSVSIVDFDRELLEEILGKSCAIAMPAGSIHSFRSSCEGTVRHYLASRFEMPKCSWSGAGPP